MRKVKWHINYNKMIVNRNLKLVSLMKNKKNKKKITQNFQLNSMETQTLSRTQAHAFSISEL